MEQERLEKSFEIYKTDTVIDRFQKLSKKEKFKLEKSFLDSTQDNKFLTEKIKQEGLGDPSKDSSIVSKMFNLFCQNKLLSDDERDTYPTSTEVGLYRKNSMDRKDPVAYGP